jgi:hypothetical protein
MVGFQLCIAHARSISRMKSRDGFSLCFFIECGGFGANEWLIVSICRMRWVRHLIIFVSNLVMTGSPTVCGPIYLWHHALDRSFHAKTKYR